MVTCVFTSADVLFSSLPSMMALSGSTTAVLVMVPGAAGDVRVDGDGGVDALVDRAARAGDGLAGHAAGEEAGAGGADAGEAGGHGVDDLDAGGVAVPMLFTVSV